MKLLTKMYVHGSREASWNRGEGLGLRGEALRTFRFALEELEVELEVDTETGDRELVAVDGRKLEAKP